MLPFSAWLRPKRIDGLWPSNVILRLFIVLSDYDYDSQGRVDKIVKSGSASTDGYSATPTVVTELVYDGSNRTVEKKLSDNAVPATESIVSSWQYDTAGRLTQKSLDCCDVVNYAYSENNDPFKVTTTNDETGDGGGTGGTVVEEYYKDGSIMKRSGTATTPMWTKTFAKSGDYLEVWSASQDFTETLPYKNNWSMRRLDWAGRTVYERSPTQDGGNLKIEYVYDSTRGHLIERTTKSHSTESGSATTERLKPYKYVYDTHGRVTLEGFDISGSGLDAGHATDRLSKTEYKFVQDAGLWWNQVEKYAFPKTDDTEVLVSRSRSRVAPDGDFLSHTSVEDSQGNTVVTKAAVDRAYDRVIKTSEFNPGPSGDAIQVYKNEVV